MQERCRQLELWLKLGSASAVARGLQSSEAETAYVKASEISQQFGDDAASFQAKRGLWTNANLSRRHRHDRRCAESEWLQNGRIKFARDDADERARRRQT
jgi:hypothetical protein